MARMKESDLFDPVKNWLQEAGYDEIFTEVDVKYLPGRPDIIARSGNTIACVELKTTLNLMLLEQAMDRQPYCHYVFVAVPERKSRIPCLSFFVKQNIGLLTVSPGGTITRYHMPRFRRPPLYDRVDWKNGLVEEFKTHVKGGHAGGGYMTRYKLTIKRAREYLERMRKFDEMKRSKREGWRSVNDILDECETHYANPKPSLSSALREIEADWCETRVVKGKRYFRAKDEKQ